MSTTGSSLLGRLAERQQRTTVRIIQGGREVKASPFTRMARAGELPAKALSIEVAL